MMIFAWMDERTVDCSFWDEYPGIVWHLFWHCCNTMKLWQGLCRFVIDPIFLKIWHCLGEIIRDGVWFLAVTREKKTTTFFIINLLLAFFFHSSVQIQQETIKKKYILKFSWRMLSNMWACFLIPWRKTLSKHFRFKTQEFYLEDFLSGSSRMLYKLWDPVLKYINMHIKLLF